MMGKEDSKSDYVSKKIGDYNVIDGQWWPKHPYGLEKFNTVQDVRMYDRTYLGGDIDTISLFRQVKSKKFFYARIVPIKNSKETKWKPMHKEEVPKIILDDLKTVNSKGHDLVEDDTYNKRIQETSLKDIYNIIKRTLKKSLRDIVNNQLKVINNGC